jgi:hypothetical protein
MLVTAPCRWQMKIETNHAFYSEHELHKLTRIMLAYAFFLNTNFTNFQQSNLLA